MGITEVIIRSGTREPITITGPICEMDGDEIAHTRTAMVEFFAELVGEEVDVVFPELEEQ